MDSISEDGSDMEPQSPQPRKKAKLASETRALKKPPTVEELNNLKMTESLFNSNLFRLQIDELLKAVSIKTKHKKALETFKSTFEEHLMSLKTSERRLSNTKSNCPYKTDQDLLLNFEKPQKWEYFDLCENAGPNIETCINVQIPKVCLNVKDYLNNRYLVKKFHYLLYIAEKFNFKLDYHDNNPLLPIGIVQPSEKIKFKIYVSPEVDYFKPSRILPNVNNVKKPLFGEVFSETTPTVLYNSVLGFDFTLSTNNQFIKNVLVNQTSAQEAIKLLNVWLKQREFDQGFGGFTPTLVSYLIVYLLTKKRINKLMSSYQIVRYFWNFLATTDFKTTLISLNDSSTDIETFKNEFPINFLDATGCLNNAAFLNFETFEFVREATKRALELLEKTDSFPELFLNKSQFPLQYDAIINLNLTGLSGELPKVELEKCVGFEQFNGVKFVQKILGKGLKTRALNVVPRVEVTEGKIVKILIGIKLNHEGAFNFIELGPKLSDQTEAAEFRKFWGHLSSDRRFRDGSTQVAVYFKSNTLRGKRAIVKRILKFLLEEKLKLVECEIHYDDLEEVIINRRVTTPFPVGTNEEASLKISSISDEFGRILRDLKLSLHVTGIQGNCGSFSFTELFPQISQSHPTLGLRIHENRAMITGNNYGRFIEPLEMVLQFEYSSKWPNDLNALRHVKTSIFLDISNKLKELGIVSSPGREFIDVLYQGLVFRLKFYVSKELMLLKNMENYLETEQYESTLFVQPKIFAALKGIQMRFATFGPTSALAKRWLRSHMIDSHHLSDLVVDLFNAALHLFNPRFNTPQSRFLNLLKFFTEFQWELQPLIVNFNEEISKDDLKELEGQFMEKRSVLQALYIIHPYDKGQSLVTRNGPTKEVLTQVRNLAKSTLELLMDRLNGTKRFNIPTLFRPNIQGFNLLIHLKPEMNSRKHETIDGTDQITIQSATKRDNIIPIVDFNPIQIYLDNLRQNYHQFATFFHDSYGGNTIGVLWKPKVHEIRPFKVSDVRCRKLLMDSNNCILNDDGLIDEFYVMGKQLVNWIERLNN